MALAVRSGEGPGGACGTKRTADLVGDRDSDDAGVERDPDTGRGPQYEAADVLTAGEHRQLDRVGRQLEPRLRPAVHRRVDDPVAVNVREALPERRGLEPAVLEAQ